MAHSPTNYIPAESHARYFELVFQLRRGTADHDMVLLAASSRLELKEALERFTKDPDSVCRIRSAEAKCLLFPRFTAVNPEMKVFVMDREIDLALGKTLKEALATIRDLKSGQAYPKVANHAAGERRHVSRAI